MKRFLDIFLAIFFLILTIPLFIVIIITIKCSSKGPIFYSDNRFKKNFQTFSCYKFRTMHINAQDLLWNILESKPELKKEWLIYQKLKNDPRITKIGAFLRKTSLDELPQLWNVLKGDMSLVGPRPYVLFGSSKDKKKDLISLYGKEIETILSFKPGLTGLWQVSGRNSLPIEKRILLDLEYVKNHSLKKDLEIILKTLPEIFYSKGAY